MQKGSFNIGGTRSEKDVKIVPWESSRKRQYFGLLSGGLRSDLFMSSFIHSTEMFWVPWTGRKGESRAVISVLWTIKKNLEVDGSVCTTV